MTLIELKQKIAESDKKDWFQSYILKLNYPEVNFAMELKGVVAIYEFILKQIDAFRRYNSLPNELVNCQRRLEVARDKIVNLIGTNDAYQISWNEDLRGLTTKPILFLPVFPETDFLIKVYQEKSKYYPGAYEYITGNPQHFANKDYFTGYMLAYEFLSKDFSAIVERKESEKRSILNTRAEFQKKLSEAENEVVEYISRTNGKFDEYASEIDKIKTQRNSEFVDWFKKITTEFDDFNKKSTNKATDLEDLYRKKLQLEAPAQYWNLRSAKLRKEGRMWLIGLIICLCVSVTTLICILNLIADGTLQQVFATTSTAIKWSVAFISLISFLAYGIRTFAKLTFSSFHLVRDAEEREQLTYVYLALRKEQQVDETERHLIMQSLFSRADSGLLKDDSGPTMPGNIVDQVIKK